MALKKANENQNTNRTAGNTPDAYLNLKIVDANGTEYRLSKGVALELNRRLDRSLINATKDNPEMEFTLKGVVNIVEEDPQEDIDFGQGNSQ